MKDKRLVINLIANIISYGTTVVITFFLTPYLVNTLGAEVYSYYPLANNFVSYMGIISLALNSMGARFITISLVKEDMEQANTYFSSIFFSNLILDIILFIPMSLIVIYLENILNIPIDIINTIKILFISIFFSMLINICTSVFGVATFAKNRIDLRSCSEIIIGLTRVILYISLFSIFTPSIIYVGVITLILSIINLFIQIRYTKKLLPNIVISRAYFKGKAIIQILSSGIWNSINQLGVLLLSSVSLVISNIFIGVTAAGDYSIAQTIPNAFSGIICALASVFIPQITYNYAKQDKEKLLNNIENAQKVLALIVNVPLAVFTVVGIDFFKLWVPNSNVYKIQLLSLILITPIIIFGSAFPLYNLNMVTNQVKIPALTMIFNGFLNIISTLMLVKFTKLGVVAIALTSSVINLVWYIVFVPIYPCKKLGVSRFTFYPPILKSILGFIVIYGVTSILKQWVIIDDWSKLILFCILGGALGIAINIMILFDLKEIKKITKKFKK